LFNHQLAVQADLNRMARKYGATHIARSLTEATVNELVRIANVMTTTGKDFVDAATKPTPVPENETKSEEQHRLESDGRGLFTQEELKEWLRIRDTQTEYELPDLILNPEDSTPSEFVLHKNMKEKINDYIKLKAVLQLSAFLDALPQDQKDAIDKISPGFIESSNQCARGQDCVMVVGRQLRSLLQLVEDAQSSAPIL
jgi:hypothetical protein